VHQHEVRFRVNPGLRIKVLLLFGNYLLYKAHPHRRRRVQLRCQAAFATLWFCPVGVRMISCNEKSNTVNRVIFLQFRMVWITVAGTRTLETLLIRSGEFYGEVPFQ